jgi:predicted NAD-dependent protein-ADP-ribosyltransferase YbiA (DUF1768 family)
MNLVEYVEYRKDEVMLNALVMKFTQNKELRHKLLSTGSTPLFEHTDKDVYWGDGFGKGQNKLGKFLEIVRCWLWDTRRSIWDTESVWRKVKDPVSLLVCSHLLF